MVGERKSISRNWLVGKTLIFCSYELCNVGKTVHTAACGFPSTIMHLLFYIYTLIIYLHIYYKKGVCQIIITNWVLIFSV